MYRCPEDRANSAVSKVGDTNLRFQWELREKGRTDRWEARGPTEETLSILILNELDYLQMNAHSAAGIFWYLRNQLFFDQRLDARGDVLLLKYEILVSYPDRVMKASLQLSWLPGLSQDDQGYSCAICRTQRQPLSLEATSSATL